ncbi:MAG: hypothetical protein ACNA75_12120 [Thiohalomonadaceae bacterium]
MPAIESISAGDLLHDLVPKLKATERLMANTLWENIQRCIDPGEKARLESLLQEFELELAMIRLNLRHLLRRHAEELEAAVKGGDADTGLLLELDEHEAVAIESARRLYRRAQEMQTD